MAELVAGFPGNELSRMLVYRSPFDNLLDELFVPRSRRTGTRTRPGDAWPVAAKALTAEEPAQDEKEVAEALFDLANMFAAAEPVLRAEEEAGSSPRRSSEAPPPRAKRQRGAKKPVAGPPPPLLQHENGRFGPPQPPPLGAARNDFGLAAQLAAAQRGDEGAAAAIAAAAASMGWDRRSPASGLSLAGLPLPPSNSLPPAMAGFYPPGGLPALAVTPNGSAGGWTSNGGGDSQPRAASSFPRCASHVYIAHFIEYQTKLERERGITAAAGGSAFNALQGKPEGFYQAGTAPPPGFPNGSAHFEELKGGGGVKQEPGTASHGTPAGLQPPAQQPAHHQQTPPQQQQQQPQDHHGQQQQDLQAQTQQDQGQNPSHQQQQGFSGVPHSNGLPFGGGLPASMAMGGGGGRGGCPPGAGAVPSAAALAQQQQQYAQQLSQLAMLSQQSGAGFPPFMPPGAPGGGLSPAAAAAFGAGGLPQQQQQPFGFGQQGLPNFSLASLLPPNMAHLAATSAGMQLDAIKGGLPGGLDALMKRSPSATQVSDAIGGLPPNASRTDAEAWASKLASSQQQQQQQQQPPPPNGMPNGVPNGGGGGDAAGNYPSAESQFKMFQEAIANSEQDRKLRTPAMQA